MCEQERVCVGWGHEGSQLREPGEAEEANPQCEASEEEKPGTVSLA